MTEALEAERRVTVKEARRAAELEVALAAALTGAASLPLST
jgi:hypothetical protein